MPIIVSAENEKQKAAVFSVFTSEKSESAGEASLAELERLLDTAGAESYAVFVQHLASPDKKTYVGSGKAREMADSCKANGITLAVCNEELSPSQIKNLEDVMTGVEVIDRSMLILEIFERHAVTAEGKLQVEIARLRYTVPRLIGKGAQLSRQGGGGSGGGGARRGAGESKLETDKRRVKARIDLLGKQLAELERTRSVQRSARRKARIPQIAVVGYTNSGKSTLLNRLTSAGVLAEDKLFATLDTTTRRLRLPNGKEVLLTDTVGFIRDLPHHLVKAFKSTLDEVGFADCVLVLADASDEQCAAQLDVTETLLAELGAAGKPTVYAFNKCDACANGLAEASRLAASPKSGTETEKTDEAAAEKDTEAPQILRGGVMISAKTGAGVDKLLQKLADALKDVR